MMTREQHTVPAPGPGTMPGEPGAGETASGRPGNDESRAGEPGDGHDAAGPGGGRLRRHRRWLVPLVVVLLLAQMTAAMVTAAAEQTPTIDEPVYVGTAAVYLREHSLAYNPEHPPLGKLLIAAGVAVADPHVDPSFTGDQGRLGRHLLYESGNDPWRLMRWARLPVIVLTLLFGLVAFAFARDLAGTAGGLAALALYAFSPDLIAHGSLATLDVPAAGFVLTSVWLLWRARRRPRLYLPPAGAALGAALATKMSTLPAAPVVGALAVLSVWAARRPAGRAARARALALGTGWAAATAAAAIAVVWAAYLAVDPRLRWTSVEPVPAVHGLRGTLTGLLPLPEAYRDGMRIQFGLEGRPWQGFLFGQVYTGARWYYLPVALAVKTPLGMIALWVAGAALLVAVRRLRAAAPYVLVPPAVLLAAAMHSSRDFGTRYALFLPMFLAVAAACVAVVRRGWVRGAAGALLAFVAVSSLRTYPYYLPYANEAFGGPARTHELLHDANVDWGQDLGRLAERLRSRYPRERIWLVYKGSGVPAYYGIHAADPRKVPPRRVRGLLVVSDSAAAKATGRLAALIDSSRPVDEVGHSITLYRR
ncbi:phospholipid carrier-dependent glycosyltransferase [Streptomyces sp. NPDC014864]|uniref:phospholipid carrier-dependent glycosyltransferase n=1 Tax=Streptomyces sp. NPDC014864 TaxID=3364924 RepID=UPI0036F4E0E4